MHHNGHWEQEISFLPVCPLSVQLFSFFIFFLSEMHCSFACTVFNVFLFLILKDFLFSCKQSPVWTLICGLLLLCVSATALILPRNLLYEQYREITQAIISQMFKSCDHIFLWAEERSSVDIQSERTTEAV